MTRGITMEADLSALDYHAEWRRRYFPESDLKCSEQCNEHCPCMSDEGFDDNHIPKDDPYLWNIDRR